MTTAADASELQSLLRNVGLAEEEAAACAASLRSAYGDATVADLRHHFRRDGDALVGYINFPRGRPEALARFREELAQPAAYVTEAEVMAAMELCELATFTYKERAFLARVEEFCQARGVLSIDFAQSTGPTLQRSAVAVMPFQGKITLLWAFEAAGQPGDGLKDARVLPKICEKLSGRVHSSVLERSQEQLVEEVVRAAAMLGARRVVTCGHGAGGAIAHVVTMQILADQHRYHPSYRPGPEGVASVSFGAPLYANAAVADFVAKTKCQSKLLHVVSAADPVPTLLSLGEASRAFLRLGSSKEEEYRALGVAQALPGLVSAYASKQPEVGQRNIERGRPLIAALEDNSEVLDKVAGALEYVPVGVYLFVEPTETSGSNYRLTAHADEVMTRVGPQEPLKHSKAPLSSKLTAASVSAHTIAAYKAMLSATPFLGYASPAVVEVALEGGAARQSNDLAGTGEGAFNSIMRFEVRPDATAEVRLSPTSRVYSIPCTNCAFIKASGIRIDVGGAGDAWQANTDATKHLQIIKRSQELWILEELVPDASGWDAPPATRVVIRLVSDMRDVTVAKGTGTFEVSIRPEHCKLVQTAGVAASGTPTWRSWLDEFFLVRAVKLAWAHTHLTELHGSNGAEKEDAAPINLRLELPVLLQQLKELMASAGDADQYFGPGDLDKLVAFFEEDMWNGDLSFDTVGQDIYSVFAKAMAWLCATKGLSLVSGESAHTLMQSSAVGEANGASAISHSKLFLGLMGTPTHPPIVPLKTALKLWLRSSGVPFVYTSAADAGENLVNSYVDLCGQLLSATRKVETPTFGYTCRDLEGRLCKGLNRFSSAPIGSTDAGLDHTISLKDRTDREFKFEPFRNARFARNMLPWTSFSDRTRLLVEQHVNALRIMQKLRKIMTTKVVGIIGKQDMGKTTLVNQLRRIMNLDGITEARGHTVHTSESKVYKLTDTCVLLDTPGVDSVRDDLCQQFGHTARVVSDIFIYVRQAVSDLTGDDVRILTATLDMNGFHSCPHVCVCLNKIGSNLEHVDGTYTQEDLEGIRENMIANFAREYKVRTLERLGLDQATVDDDVELDVYVESYISAKMSNMRFVFTDLLFTPERLEQKGIKDVTWTSMNIAVYLEEIMRHWSQGRTLSAVVGKQGAAKEEASLRMTMAIEHQRDAMC